MLEAARCAGHTVMLEPGAVVEHTVSCERLDAGYYWRRFYWQGITRARMGGRIRRLGGSPSRCPAISRRGRAPVTATTSIAPVPRRQGTSRSGRGEHDETLDSHHSGLGRYAGYLPDCLAAVRTQDRLPV